MNNVFIYWDNSNIFHEAPWLAEEREESPDARRRVRIDFNNIYRLAHAGRKVERAYVAGSVPPAMRQLWIRLENKGIKVELFDRIERGHGEQEVPDRFLQLHMLEDALDFNGDPGIAVLLTGDGAGYLEGSGFHRTLERMHKKGWQIEILSWENSCNPRMKRWAEQNGKFIALDDFYEAITFLEPSNPGSTPMQARNAAKLDLTKRPG
ncbi:MAG: NYN domain-containing protein [Gammaproteobacteria bacterium]